jgi:hypothetical protein
VTFTSLCAAVAAGNPCAPLGEVGCSLLTNDTCDGPAQAEAIAIETTPANVTAIREEQRGIIDADRIEAPERSH